MLWDYLKLKLEWQKIFSDTVQIFCEIKQIYAFQKTFFAMISEWNTNLSWFFSVKISISNNLTENFSATYKNESYHYSFWKKPKKTPTFSLFLWELFGLAEAQCFQYFSLGFKKNSVNFSLNEAEISQFFWFISGDLPVIGQKKVIEHWQITRFLKLS